MPTQSLQIIGFAKESVAGTFVTPTKFVPGTAAPSSGVTVSRPTQSRGTLSQVLDVPTAQTAGLQVSCELIPEVISQLIAGWFGTGSDAVTGSGTVGYTHTLTPQVAKPTFSFEVDNDIYSQILARQFAMCMVDQVALTYQAQQIVTAQFTMVGQRELTPATPGLPSNPTPAVTTLQPMDFSLLACDNAGVASTQLISATLTLANQTQPVPSSNGELYITRLQPTMRQVTFSTTLDFLDSTWYQNWANTKGSGGFVSTPGLSLALVTANDIPTTSNPYKVQFNLPTLRPQDQYAINAASDVLQQQLTWSVTQGSAADEVDAVIVNSESTALA